MNKKLTKRQEEVLDFLKTSYYKMGFMPSTREIQEHFGFASQTAAMGHLRALEKKGAIERLPGKARAVIFPDAKNREKVLSIPIFGSIAAGFAEMQEQHEEGRLSVNPTLFKIDDERGVFALCVRGDSMIDAHICDGDTVILKQQEPTHGDIVAALIDGETTLKRFVQTKNNQAYLRAENIHYPNLIPTQELVIQGVMTGLIRKF